MSDGILPTFTVTLSGGSGLNEDVDGEGSSELTKSQMKLSVSANEAIQGAPQFAVVCSNLLWNDDADGTGSAEFASNRTGAYTTGEIGKAAPDETNHTADDAVPKDEIADIRTMCPDDNDAEDDSDYFFVTRTNVHRRAGNNWEYDWSNLTGTQKLADGDLVVIVWGRDRSSYMREASTGY